MSFAGCATKSSPKEDDLSRPCILGAVPASQLEQVRVWAESARVGDYLLNPTCDEQQMERDVNEIRRDTR